MKKEALPMDKVNLISSIPFNKIRVLNSSGNALKPERIGLGYRRNWADNDYQVNDNLNRFLEYLEEFGQEPIDTVFLDLEKPHNTVRVSAVSYNLTKLLVALSERFDVIFYIPKEYYKKLGFIELITLARMSKNFNKLNGKTLMYDSNGNILDSFSETNFKEEDKENVLTNPLLLIDNLSKETGFSIPASKKILKLFQRKIKRLSNETAIEQYYVIENGEVNFLENKSGALNFDEFLPDILEGFIDLSDEISLRIKEKDYEEMNRNEKAILNRYILMAIQEYVNQNAHYDDKKGKIRGKNPFIKKAEEEVQQGLRDSRIIPEYTDYGNIDDAFQLLEETLNQDTTRYDYEMNEERNKLITRLKRNINENLENYLKENFEEIYNVETKINDDNDLSIRVSYRSYVGGDIRERYFTIEFTDGRITFANMQLSGKYNSKTYTSNPFRPMADIMLFVNSALGRETSSKIPINVTPGFRREGLAQRADVVALDFFNREIDRYKNNPRLIAYEKLSMNTLTGTVKGGALMEYYNHGLVLISGETHNNPKYSSGEMVICNSLIQARFDFEEHNLVLRPNTPACIHTENDASFYVGDSHAPSLLAYLYSEDPEGPKSEAHLYAPQPLVIRGRTVNLNKILRDENIKYSDFKINEHLIISIKREDLPFVEE